MSSKFSAEERKAFTDAFVLFDRDGSGTIDIAEFADVAAELNIGMTLQEVQELIATVDTDGSGEIDLEEFLTIMAQKLHHGGDVDTDDDGGSEGDDEEDELWIALGSMPAQEDAGESPMFDPGAHRRPTFEALSVHELHFRAGKLQTFCEELVHAMAVERDESAATPSGDTRASRVRSSIKGGSSDQQPSGRSGVSFPGQSTGAALSGGPPDRPPRSAVESMTRRATRALTKMQRTMPFPARTVPTDTNAVLRFLKETVAALEERAAAMVEYETVEMDARPGAIADEARRVAERASRPILRDEDGHALVSRGEALLGRSLRAGAGNRTATIHEAAVDMELQRVETFELEDPAAIIGTDMPRHAIQQLRSKPETELQGSAAYRYYVEHRLQYNVACVGPVCEQLDLADEVDTLYANTAGENEFLLKPQCPEGAACRDRHDIDHRRQFTHPCYAEGIGKDGEQCHCPHMHRRVHMQCYRHGTDGAHQSTKDRLAELEPRLGLVDIDGCEIGDNGALAVSHVLRKDAQRAAKDVAGGSSYKLKYTRLNLQRNHISPPGAMVLLNAAAELVSLDLGRNRLGTKSLQLVGHGIGGSLRDLLVRTDKLTSLDLSSNHLGDTEGRAIADGLQQNVSLRHLNASNNDFGPDTGVAFAAAMNENRELRELVLGYNPLEISGASALLGELQHSATIEVIDLSWSGVDDSCAVMLASLIQDTVVLRSVIVPHNTITSKGATALAKATNGNHSLQLLDVSFNPLGNAGAQELVREVTQHKSLEVLDIRCVKADEVVTKAVGVALSERHKQKLPPMTIRFTPELSGRTDIGGRKEPAPKKAEDRSILKRKTSNLNSAGSGASAAADRRRSKATTIVT